MRSHQTRSEQLSFSLLFLSPPGSTHSVLQDCVYTRQIRRETVSCKAALARISNSNTREAKNSCRREQKGKRSGGAFWNSFNIFLSSWDATWMVALPPTPSNELEEKGGSILWTIQRVGFVPIVSPSEACSLSTSGKKKQLSAYALLWCLADSRVNQLKRENFQENC